MLSGKLPYEGNTPIGLIMKHMTQPVPDILAIKSDLPPGCREVMVQAMAKDRELRFATATAFATALTQAHEIHPVTSLPGPASRDSSLETEQFPDQETVIVPAPAGEVILCPKCQAANPAQSHFCAVCNTRLQIDCPMCHKSNSLEATHCYHCGADLKRSQAMRLGLEKARQKTLSKRDQAFKEKAARQMREKLQAIFEGLESRKTRVEAARQLEQLIKQACNILAENLLNGSDPLDRLASAKYLRQLYEWSELEPELKQHIIDCFVSASDEADPQVQEQVKSFVNKYAGRRREISDIFKGLMGWLKGE
jgi:hypothetical protein